VKRDSKYDAYLQTWATNPLHADFTLTALFNEKFSDRNMYANSEVSSLIDRARAEVDEKEAQQLYQRAQEQLMRDLPWVPIAVIPNVIGMNRSVQGLQLRAQEAIFFWSVTKR
jgi:ABC-type transport system substrate-binding protein